MTSKTGTTPQPLRMTARLLQLLRPHARSYGAVCLVGVFIAALEMVPPRLVGGAVDAMNQGSFSAGPIMKLALIWLAISGAAQLLTGMQIRQANRNGERILARLRELIFTHLQNLSMSFYDRTQVGKILTLASSDVDAIRQVLIWGLNTVVANAAIMLMAGFMIYHTDAWLFLSTCWLAPLMTVVNFYYGKRVATAWQKVRRHFSLVGANQAENIAGVKVVLAFNRQEENLRIFNELQELNTANNVMASGKAGLFNPILQWVKFAGLAILLLVGGYRIVTRDLGPGQLVSILLYWDWFMTPAINFGTFFNDLLIAGSSAERIFDLLDEVPEMEEPLNTPDLPAIKGHVQFENVSFQYSSCHRKVLDGVSLEAQPGQLIALVGETGSGKSTIISLLSKFYQIGEGRILIDGIDINSISAWSLHRQVAMVMQANFLFSGSILENIRYGSPDVRLEEIHAAARELGCHSRFMAMKSGYETDVGERGQSLSLGERQLVCFTRALVTRPRLLLLDEATSALDPMTGLQVQRALSRLTQGRTTFIVTHRLSSVRHADQIFVVSQGKIIEKGRHHELIQKGGKYRELFYSSLPKSQKSLGPHVQPLSQQLARLPSQQLARLPSQHG